MIMEQVVVEQPPSNTSMILQPPAQRTINNEQGKCQLFVGNLPPTITKEDLEAVFARFGAVAHVHVMHGKSQSGHACGFVWLDEMESAEKAIDALHKTWRIDSFSEKITVQYARNWIKNNKGSSPHQTTSTTPFVNRRIENLAHEFTNHLIYNDKTSFDDNKPGKLFVGNLPGDIERKELIDIFRVHGTVIDCHIMDGRRAESGQACAFVEYCDRETALVAIEAFNNKFEVRPGFGTIVCRFQSREKKMKRFFEHNKISNTSTGISTNVYSSNDSSMLSNHDHHFHGPNTTTTTSFVASPTASNSLNINHGGTIMNNQTSSWQYLQHSNTSHHGGGNSTTIQVVEQPTAQYIIHRAGGAEVVQNFNHPHYTVLSNAQIYQAIPAPFSNHAPPPQMYSTRTIESVSITGGNDINKESNVATSSVCCQNSNSNHFFSDGSRNTSHPSSALQLLDGGIPQVPSNQNIFETINDANSTSMSFMGTPCRDNSSTLQELPSASQPSSCDPPEPTVIWRGMKK